MRLVRCILPKTGKMRPDWPERWKAAGEKVGWEGVVDREKWKAEKESPIWKTIASIFPDGTHSETPPFAINSGMGWENEKGELIHPGLEEMEEEEEYDISEDEIIEIALEQLL